MHGVLDSLPFFSLVNFKSFFCSPFHACNCHLLILLMDILLNSADMTADFTSLLVETIFRTLPIYDDRGSRKAVDNLIVKLLNEVAFMKNFAATLVQAMEKQLKFQSHVVCYRLIKWSCLLLTESQFTSVSRNALCRVAQSQASVLHIAMQGSFRVKRLCKQSLLHLFSKVSSLVTVYWI